MVRSMYAGVAGMKAHQSKMDVIGNNIANVNTYGFKASRVTFRDIYYQTSKNSSGATANRGGVNAAQVGYGAQLGSVDVLQTRSSFTMTDNGFDVAIAGEGFFQVQDADGNTFYTRAGLLNIDAAGNLVDLNGNFVLGVADSPIGQDPSSNRIQLSVPSVNPASATGKELINGVTFDFTTTNQTKEGNVSLNFLASESLPLGQKVSATITTAGINIQLNKSETFNDLDELNKEINAAIKNANGGKEHPAGVFNITMNPANKFPAGLTGEEIASKDFSPKLGSLEIQNGPFLDTINFKEVGTEFIAAANTGQIKLEKKNPSNELEMTITINGNDTYKGIIPVNATNPGTIKLQKTGAGANANDYVVMTHGGYTQLEAKLTAAGAQNPQQTALTNITSTKPSQALGLSSKPIRLNGGTEGGPQTVADLSSIGIGGDGVIEGIHPVHGKLQLGRIDLVTFDNPQGLEQMGNSYFKASPNSGEAKMKQAGQDGAGALAAGSLEMSNVDLSREFSDMITTQRGFQANSRLITVSDEMLNELVNLKR